MSAGPMMQSLIDQVTSQNASGPPAALSLGFRRALGQQGMGNSRDAARGVLAGMGFGNVGDSDEAIGEALRNANAGSSSRWTGGGERSVEGEIFGGSKATTAAGSTGASVAFTVEIDVEELEDVVLYIWDPSGILCQSGAYLDNLEIGKKSFTLGVDDTEWLPVRALDYDTYSGEAQKRGGLYVASRLQREQVITGTLYIPTSTVDVTWGTILMARPTSVDDRPGAAITGRGSRRGSTPTFR